MRLQIHIRKCGYIRIHIHIHRQRNDAKGNDYRERKILEAQKRKTLNRVSKVEELIDETENKIRELTQESEDPGIASDYVKLSEIGDRIDALHRELDGYMEEWEMLQQTIIEMGYDT